jgi:hypothetical protein
LSIIQIKEGAKRREGEESSRQKTCFKMVDSRLRTATDFEASYTRK